MTEYTVKAYPAVYLGRQYRSRLEARWAAFFDLLGWEAEYEPFDLGPWSPDFLLRGAYGHDVLVEVKPISEFNACAAEKMVGGCVAGGPGLTKRPRILLVGISPRPVDPTPGLPFVQIGWLGDFPFVEPRARWIDAILGWVPTCGRPGMVADLVYSGVYETPVYRMSCGLLAPHAPEAGDATFYPDHAMDLWARAANEVQWHPAGGQS